VPVEVRTTAAWQLLVRVTLSVLAIYLVWRVRGILTTVLIAVVLASAANALVEPLCRLRVRFLRRRTQRTIATAFVFLLLASGVVGAVALLFTPFQTEYTHLQQNWTTYKDALIVQLARAQEMFAGLPPQWQDFLRKSVSGSSLPSPAAWLSGALGTTVSWMAHIVELIIIPVLAFYFTLDARSLRNEALVLIPRSRLRQTIAILDEGGAILRDYVVAQFWLAVIAGVVVGIGLKLVGMDYALILGIFAGITRAIPVIGPLIGGVPIVALALVTGAQQHNPLLWIEVLGFFTLLHLVESKFVMPKFLGHRLHLHAAMILIALLIGGEFFGLIGMFLAAPVAALARVLITHYLILPRRRAEQQARRRAAGSSATTGRILRLERAIRTMTPTASHHATAMGAVAAAAVRTNPPPSPAKED